MGTGDVPWHDASMDAATIPTHTNVIDEVDGYRREAALFVDEMCMNSPPIRSERIGSVFFRSVVRFRTGDYVFRSTNGENRLVQVGIGLEDSAPLRHLNGEPSSEQAGRATVQNETCA